jgi:DNA polymerase-3 subunit gamma/tau
MSYLVLARKWRPMRFEDLVGQEHVARTLANAIASGRVAHAFLFTGVRGVGKTTSARILAKSLNCMGDPAARAAGDPGPTATPCLKCPACTEIAAGTDVDVREIDGASYNGVDEVRKLQDSLPYRPTRDRSKIFIVDEVHMLSQSAWNAFLKTLEEPPPHVKFIFATTEVHKVPVTILSRVQRFDFKLIPTKMIAERLRYVLTQESIGSDDAAISIIAREAAGSMRDAMSLLDQVIAYDAARLDGAIVSRVLGVASRQVLHDIGLALVDGNPQRCLEIVGELANLGYDVAHVARDLLELLRDLVVAKVCAEPGSLLDVADEEKRDLLALAQRSDGDDLLRLHQAFSQAFDEVVRAQNPRGALEMLLVRLARRPALVPLDDLFGRLTALERRLTGGGGSRPAGGGSGRPSPDRAAPPPRPPQDRGNPPDVAMRQRPREPAAPGGERSAPERDRAEEPPPRPTSPPRAESPSDRALATNSDVPPFPTRTPSGPPARATAAVGSTAAGPPQQLPKPVVQLSPAAAEALSEWRKILDRVRDERPELAAFFEHALPLTVTPQEVVLGWEPGSIFGPQVSDKAAIECVARAATAHFGVTPAVQQKFDVPASPAIATVAAQETQAREERARRAYLEAKQHPRITDAIEVLGARLKDLKLAVD